jgi:hypothetical protein
MPRIGLKEVESRCAGGRLAAKWDEFGGKGLVENASVDVD